MQEGPFYAATPASGASPIVVAFVFIFGNFTNLDPFRTVGVTHFMGRVAVGTVNGRMSAGRALLANWEGAWVLLGLMGICTDRAAGVVPA